MFVITSSNLADTASKLRDMSSEDRVAAMRAINRTAKRARTLSAKQILEQVNLPKSYLNPSQGRLTVSKQANKNDLTAIIRGRRQATSLARFVTTKTARGGVIRLNVKPGRSVFSKRMFLYNLKNGNTGLAYRSPDGRMPSNTRKALRMRNGLFLLYGPSVNQVFQTVRDDITPQVQTEVEIEFRRLKQVDLKRAGLS